MAGLAVTPVGLESLDELEPLWKALHAHHGSVAPRLAGRGTRSADEGWRLRRQTYEEWLSQPEPFCLLARLDGRPVGYAMVTLGGGLRSWRWAIASPTCRPCPSCPRRGSSASAPG